VHAAVLETLGADQLVELLDVEIDSGSGRRGRRRFQRRLAFGQRGADRGRHLDRIAVSAEVQVEQRRTGPQQVIVHGRVSDSCCHVRAQREFEMISISVSPGWRKFLLETYRSLTPMRRRLEARYLQTATR
jgi:hypothetical protein